MVSLKEPKGGPLGAIEKARARVAELKAERARIADGPTSFAEARAVIALAIERHAADWRANCESAFFGSPQGEWNRQSPYFAETTLAPPLSVVDPDKLTSILFEETKRYIVARGGEGLPSHERPAAVAELDAQILEAEIAEEEAVCAAERAGFNPLRRADADPRAVLSIA
jgi:hypothetical protein